MAHALPLSVLIFILVVIASAPWGRLDPRHKFALDSWAYLAAALEANVAEPRETTNVA